MCILETPLYSTSDLQPSPRWRNRLLISCKRVIDLSSAPLLVALLPLFLIVGVIVKLTSPGPIFYRWRVVGKDGRSFVSYKFRTMVANADQLKAALQAYNEMSGPVFKMTYDPRVTRVGVWLRRYSLDELPQLYSVLKGDMSLVGPRPPLVTEYAHFTDFQKQKLAVKPGITCLWQISGRNSVQDFDHWVKLDLDYINKWSLLLDIKILALTLREVLSGSGK